MDRDETSNPQSVHNRALTKGGEAIAIVGLHFGTSLPTSSPIVYVGGIKSPFAKWVSDSQITATVPPGAGAMQNVSVVVEGIASESSLATLDYAVPLITGVEVPFTGGNMTITGQNFGPVDASVEVDARAIGQLVPVDCQNPKMKSSDHSVIQCDFGLLRQSNNSCFDLHLVLKVQGQLSNRFPICWGQQQFNGKLIYNEDLEKDEWRRIPPRMQIQEGQIGSQLVRLQVDPKRDNVYIQISSQNVLCRILDGEDRKLSIAHEFRYSIPWEQLLINVAVAEDGIHSAKGYPAGECQLAFKMQTKDDHFHDENGNALSDQRIVRLGSGCGIGEYINADNAKDVDEATGLSLCTCTFGYYRDATGWCSPCPVGADCDRIGAQLKTLRSLENYWREDINSTVFHRCDSSYTKRAGEGTPCSGGYSINGSQCANRHGGPLCLLSARQTCFSEKVELAHFPHRHSLQTFLPPHHILYNTHSSLHDKVNAVRSISLLAYRITITWIKRFKLHFFDNFPDGRRIQTTENCNFIQYLRLFQLLAHPNTVCGSRLLLLLLCFCFTS